MTPFQRRVAAILGAALQRHEFALGGGQALQAHRIIDRPSNDLDNSASQDPQVFVAAERDLIAVLGDAGLAAVVVRRDSWFRQIIVTDASTGEQLGLDLGYDYRKRPPVFIAGIGPVLDIEDVVTGKVRALVDRQAERDYMDIDALLSTGDWPASRLFAIVHEMRPELGREDFERILSASHEGDPEEYAALGLDPTQALEMFARLSHAAESLTEP